MSKKRNRVMGLFGNFDEAFAAINDIKANKITGVVLDDVTTMTPIEHPDIDDILGDRPAHGPKVTLCGATFGLSFGFLFLASAQSNFLVQPQGGKPVIPVPTNIVLSYEMLILFSVIFTVVAFIVLAGMGRKRDKLYAAGVCIDQIGVIVAVDDNSVEPVKNLFRSHQVLEIREEVR